MFKRVFVIGVVSVAVLGGLGGGDTVLGNVSYMTWLTQPACAFTTYWLNLPVIIGR